MSKWTPGPWLLHNQGGQLYVIAGPKTKHHQHGEPVCHVRAQVGGHGSTNARLIAAAPTIADALRDLLGVVDGEPGYDDMEAATEAARAALRLADGEQP